LRPSFWFFNGLLERAEDLFLLGEATLFVLGEDQLPIDDHVELAGGSDHEGAVDAGVFLDRSRETRSTGFVVSDVAVLDLDFLDHGAKGGAAAGRWQEGQSQRA
jgi:hypothetical protein